MLYFVMCSVLVLGLTGVYPIAKYTGVVMQLPIYNILKCN